MKFTKTAVALAIAGIAAAPMIASADTTLSGLVQIKVQGSDADDDATTPTKEGDIQVAAGDVLFGIVTNHEMSSGLTGYGSLRADIDSLSNEGVADADSVYVGMKGGFGDIRFGEIPVAVEYGQVANDIFDISGEINGGLSYVGGFGPVGLIANYSPENNSEVFGLGAKVGLGGFNLGVGFQDGRIGDQVAGADSETGASYSVGGSFAIAGVSLAAHYWEKETSANDSDESISVVAGYGIGGFSGKVTFATLEGSEAGGADQEALRLDLQYDLGGGTEISTRITDLTDNAGNADLADWRIQLTKFF